MRALSVTAASMGVVVLAAIVAGCATTTPGIPSLPLSSSASTRTAHIRPALSYVTLHSFGSGLDGAKLGTIYKITTTGTETVLYGFGLGSDGAEPLADFLYRDGTLYGTTYQGGAYGGGIVYSFIP